MKRALVLGGGGAKIGWAAGVLEVLVDETDMTFDHVDATSGAVWNLAMLLSGKSGHEIAEAWCEVSPWDFVSFHPWYRYLTFWRLPSLLTQDSIRDRMVPRWGIDVDAVRACRDLGGHPVVGTFNVCDFGSKRLVTIANDEIDGVELLTAIDAVPGVVPPVVHDGRTYVDAMLLSEANIGEAVRRGADEIWVIWTIENRDVWKGGTWNHLGHVFEICAVGNLHRQLDEIEAMNERVAGGVAVEGDRRITVHLLEPAEPLDVDYLVYKSKRQMRGLVESGRTAARTYLATVA